MKKYLCIMRAWVVLAATAAIGQTSSSGQNTSGASQGTTSSSQGTSTLQRTPGLAKRTNNISNFGATNHNQTNHWAERSRTNIPPTGSVGGTLPLELQKRDASRRTNDAVQPNP